jgi:4-amino-4-deoxy-L-arabinose transferase-like glycosyltransferase
MFFLSPTRLASRRWLQGHFQIEGLNSLADRTPLVIFTLLLWCGFLFFYGITAGDLYRTEGLRGIIAAEFLRSGNWIVPTLYGEPLFTKPPGMYLAIALASQPFGQVTEWTARLPAALAATATVFLFYFYFRRQIGPGGGLVVALVLPVSFMWLDKATAAEIDMLQVAWVSLALICFLRALEICEDRESNVHLPTSLWFLWLAALVAVACGVLTKWTAPAFFYGTVLPLLWWRGRLRLLKQRHHLVAAGVGAAFCLAWAGWAIALGGWEPFQTTVLREGLMHISPSHHHRPYPWLESLVHPLRILGASLPISLFALPALWPGFASRWDERGRRCLQALHCWTWPNLLLWSLVPEHAPRQSFPLFPGLAGLAAMVWAAWLTKGLAWPFPKIAPGKVLIGLLIAWFGVKLAFVHAVVPERMHKRAPRHKAEQIRALVPEEAILYLFRLKDEGIMFYYGRQVRRLQRFEQLPSSGEPAYCILDEPEWNQRDQPMEVLLHLNDEQGAPIVLVRTKK